LPLGSWSNRVGRKVQKAHGFDLNHPIETLEILADSKSNGGAIECVLGIARGGGEPFPVLDAVANTAPESYWAELNGDERVLRYQRRTDYKEGRKQCGPGQLIRHSPMIGVGLEVRP
jgi:hypothetical protein